MVAAAHTDLGARRPFPSARLHTHAQRDVVWPFALMSCAHSDIEYNGAFDAVICCRDASSLSKLMSLLFAVLRACSVQATKESVRQGTSIRCTYEICRAPSLQKADGLEVESIFRMSGRR